MPSTRKKVAKGSNQTAKIAKGSGKIAKFFPNCQASSPTLKMEPRGPSRDSPDPIIHPVSPAASVNSDTCSDSPTASLSVPGPSSQPPTLCMDSELRALLHALQTKADIETLICRLEEQHRKDFLGNKRDVQSLSTHLTTRETSLETLQRMTTLESQQDTHTRAAVTLQLHMEDRSHRNNLRLRGLPEATGPEDLETAMAIFRMHFTPTWNWIRFTEPSAPRRQILMPHRT